MPGQQLSRSFLLRYTTSLLTVMPCTECTVDLTHETQTHAFASKFVPTSPRSDERALTVSGPTHHPRRRQRGSPDAALSTAKGGDLQRYVHPSQFERKLLHRDHVASLGVVCCVREAGHRCGRRGKGPAKRRHEKNMQQIDGGNRCGSD
jgi:hypothetical protein